MVGKYIHTSVAVRLVSGLFFSGDERPEVFVIMCGALAVRGAECGAAGTVKVGGSQS